MRPPATELLRLQASVELQGAAEGKPARVVIVAYSGGIMQPSGFGDAAIDLAGLKLPSRLPLLADHEQALGAVAGHGAPRVEGGQLLVLGELASVGSGPTVLALLRAGTPLQASVGVDIAKKERLAADTGISINGRKLTAGRDGLLVVRTGTLKEVSILPLGADADTSVSL